MRFYFFFLSVALLLAGCGTQKVAQQEPQDQPEEYSEVTEYRELDTMTVSAPRAIEEPTEETYELPEYNPSHERSHDLLHTKLEVGFNWEEEQVMGKATLKLKPYFYATDKLVLDAKNFEFNSITYAGQSEPLKYEYDGQQVTIDLGKTLTRNDEYTLVIDYTATPRADGGSAAITSDKGLFFINPRGEEGDKPMQIWTQGETENNSRWFPTIDKPNERTTQEIYVTVDDRFVTLSNGLLESSTKNSDGTRTDYWKMDQPHAPYLFMLAVGEFAKVTESWNDIPVEYYVEPEFEEDAKAIFPYTPEMLSLFSDKLGVEFPWQKYAQIVVRDYVSGAMENTTASIFGEFMQRSARELIDEHQNEKVVAHELFHQWFGDYVTTESWANLTMNEGFANYSEYLWMEHKYGRDAADYHLAQEWSGYFGSAQGGVHPLIYFGYDDKEDMFDAHSYNKGGSVLHMLRNMVGDDAFFAALKKYLTENAYSDVEAHELRLAFEDVTGQDLNWFFNQWYFNQGHPVMTLNYDYDEAAGEASLTVEQTQSPENMPAIFELRTFVDVYKADGTSTRYPVHVTEREQTFTFPATERPALINFDPSRSLLAIRQDNKSDEELMFQFKHAPRFVDRFEAMQKLSGENMPEVKTMLNEALKDDFWVIRAMALQNLQPDENTIPIIRELAKNDERSDVRATAFAMLAEMGDEESLEIAKTAIEKDQSYSVVASALAMINELQPELALQYAQKLEDVSIPEIVEMVGDIYIAGGKAENLAFFEKNIEKLDGFSVINFMDSYQALAVNVGLETAKVVAGRLEVIAMDANQSQFKRFGATRAIVQMKQYYREQIGVADADEKAAIEAQISALDAQFQKIFSNENDPQLKSLYQRLQVP
ncbi:M1 family aminopeptidase [Flavilitoribacter nigricans]|uniref:Aminopeptidase N n=1 Tax=Flavilitoribacter nigricans (strain ATCC 23147 / DSM 23189 / NBRC 102662 / NCIMB 1420 / SS-2) TaxID=1122177 RepID=A0A2D0N6B8_FLAN2|nr:M1 family aminopeptidase [Flavilitoribacter nigricans]PHN03926.1 alanyl aminopeptidase [Flavilitoribacter nigricans DSM 23189 = NBRC 102662]